MKNTFRLIAVAALAAVGVVLASGTAVAAPEPGGAQLPVVGYDVSYPQCDVALPGGPAFVVVGVNGGLSTRPNRCLADQLEYAAEATGAVTGQPPVQLYLNTANPGQVIDQVTTWPQRGGSPYGVCEGDNTTACAWLYGWERAQQSVRTFFVPAAQEAGASTRPDGYTWWLDVETMNTWQYGSSAAQESNRAVLEGMTTYLDRRGAEVGLYSTGQQWGQIVGGSVDRDSALAGLDSWLAGSTSLAGAVASCADPALVPDGEVTMIQYVVDGLDHNHACR